MTQYLYGASIQGIQGYIFETNKLLEIVGASEIVEQLCTKDFMEFAENPPKEEFITMAAGNIKWLTTDEELVQKVVLEWPKKVAAKAPGLTVSQAVVIVGENLVDSINDLEKKLKTARNKAGNSLEMGPMAVIRSRRTGRPAVDWGDEGKPRDEAVKMKSKTGREDAPHTLMEKCFIEDEQKKASFFPFDIVDILDKESDNSWLAVVHADGNSLGNLIQQMAAHLKNYPELAKEAFRDFSKKLDLSTKEAAQSAIKEIIMPAFEKNNKLGKRYPFRPVVLGGDDLTVIIRSDLAFEFTEVFLKEFQAKTKENFTELVKKYNLNDFKEGLTACAGIAYMKDSFPFYYTVNLAESLCADAKKESKKINSQNVPASIAFHKIQDSFVESYQDIIHRELTVSDAGTKSPKTFKYGPYFVDKIEGHPAIRQLLEMRDAILEDNAPQSGIRQWLTTVHQDLNKADLWMDRIHEITENKYKKALSLSKEGWENNLHLYDVMSLASVSKKGVK